MPSTEVRTFTDPDAYHAAISHVQVKGMVTGRGLFHAESTRVRLDRLFLYRNEVSLPRIAYSAVDPKMFGIVFAIHPDQRAYVNGVELSEGHVVVFGAGSMGFNRSETACRWGSIALTHEDLAAVGQLMIGRELTAPPFTHRFRSSVAPFVATVEPP